MKVLDLFCGTRSVGVACDARGIQSWSIDIDKIHPADRHMDILEWTPKDVPFVPDFIWMSPPCTSWSIAQHCHRYSSTQMEPLTPTAVLGEACVMKCLEVIDYYATHHPETKWMIENPRGLLRHFPPMADLPHKTVFLCQYGKPYMKATDLWTNVSEWQPTGDICPHRIHEAHVRPRGKASAIRFGSMPVLLIHEVLDAIEGAARGVPCDGDGDSRLRGSGSDDGSEKWDDARTKRRKRRREEGHFRGSGNTDIRNAKRQALINICESKTDVAHDRSTPLKMDPLRIDWVA